MSKQVLLVNQSRKMLDKWSGFLSENGIEVVGQAEDGEKAIELAHELKPDLILFDVELPKLNGIKASEIIYKAYRIPSLFITDDNQLDDVEEDRKAQIIGCLNKQSSEAGILAEVKKALVQSEKQRLYEEKVMALDLSVQQRKSIEKAKSIIMRKRKINEEKAYDMLRNLSKNKHLPIVKIAELIIQKDQLIRKKQVK